jgi:hypothetical protein
MSRAWICGGPTWMSRPRTWPRRTTSVCRSTRLHASAAPAPAGPQRTRRIHSGRPTRQGPRPQGQAHDAHLNTLKRVLCLGGRPTRRSDDFKSVAYTYGHLLCSLPASYQHGSGLRARQTKSRKCPSNHPPSEKSNSSEHNKNEQ